MNRLEDIKKEHTHHNDDIVIPPGHHRLDRPFFLFCHRRDLLSAEEAATAAIASPAAPNVRNVAPTAAATIVAFFSPSSAS